MGRIAGARRARRRAGAFPAAFQQGPAARAEADPRADGVGLGDVGDSAPENWIVGGPTTPEVHLVVSLYAPDADCLEEVSGGCAPHSPRTAHRARHPDSDAPPSRDGPGTSTSATATASPSRGSPALPRPPPDLQPAMPAGDLLLGRDYVNSFGGNYAGRLPGALTDNATYGAFRILEQDVAGFEELSPGGARRRG